MYKISVPISIQSIRDGHIEEDLRKYLDYFNRGKIERVFVICSYPMYTFEADEEISSEKFKTTVAFFKKNGIETGIWISGFGHGSPILYDRYRVKHDYQKQQGVLGESCPDGICPLDEQFSADYMNSVRIAASNNPDLLMIDDDFRLNFRPYNMGCMCPLHLKKYYELLGEEIPREEIERLVFTGGQNKYRDAFLEVSRKSLVDFAKKIRETVDSINPEIRAGVCIVPSTWDFEGTDAAELAQAFAGNTKPFLRPFGAPYHTQFHDSFSSINSIERERMETRWTKQLNENIEVFAEGDLYPRVRHNIPSKLLELYDLALMCDGTADGILKYMFKYDKKLTNEQYYIDAHIKYVDRYNEICNIFKDKSPVGVPVFSAVHKFREQVFGDDAVKGIASCVAGAMDSYAVNILSKNSIPTCYTESEYPVAVFGEHARQIPLKSLKNGAIIDSTAAEILKERGVDTGIKFSTPLANISSEYYCDYNDTEIGISGCSIKHIEISDNATVKSYVITADIEHSRHIGSYTYENADGTRFFVFAGDFQTCDTVSAGYFNSYFRQQQLVEGIEWICGKKMPAVSLKSPNLYILTSSNGNALSVLLINFFPDEINAPIVALDKAYDSAEFYNCNGKINGNTVTLTDIAPYGFAAFEVK